MICRILTRHMGVDGSAWWVQILGVSSLILKELSSTLNWKLSIFSSSKGLPPPLPDAKAVFGCKESWTEEEEKVVTLHFPCLFSTTCGLLKRRKRRRRENNRNNRDKTSIVWIWSHGDFCVRISTRHSLAAKNVQ